jgi:hypothetical protein
MKKILPTVLIGMLVLTGLGASALHSDQTTPGQTTQYQPPEATPSPKDYTHTVLVEVGTATWCSACPQSNTAWHTIYESGTYDFEYTELVEDKNPVAYARFFEFNPAWVPTSYWDAGMFVYPGTNIATFYQYLDAAGARPVPDLVSDLNATWLGNAQIQITYSVLNNDASDYPGHLRIYVLELESTLWNDYSGHPYNHAFLDFPVNEAINIPAGDSISDTVTWDGAAAGYPAITQDNIQVILAVFTNTPHESYSDPPSGNPFNAYYSDEAIAVTLGGTQNEPPTTPVIDGPTTGVVGTEYAYTFSSTDPDGDAIYYCLNWSDGTGEVCTGPFPSGEVETAHHTWTEPGTYLIKITAHDDYDATSDPGTYEVTIEPAPALSISVAGGFGVSGTITNTGTTDLTHIAWSITLDGSMIFLGKSTTATMAGITGGSEKTIKSKFVFGFGKTNIVVSASCDEGVTAELTKTAFVLGPLVLAVK